MIITPAVKNDLAPTGKLRVGINYGNPVLAKRDPSSGALHGVAVDLARELGRRADVAVDLIGYESAGTMFEAVKTGAWDIAFLAIDPGRAHEVDFTAAYVEIEGTYLSPAGSPFRSVGDVDRAGVRIGVSAKSAYDLFLSRNIQQAHLVRASNPDAAFDLLLSGQVDVVAGVRQHLAANAAKLPGARVFEDRFMAIQQAVGIVKGRPAGAEYLCKFIEDAKASGLVARALQKAGVSGVSVPPAASL
jgi:polar amino acid transport system substrate-binding protein